MSPSEEKKHGSEPEGSSTSKHPASTRLRRVVVKEPAGGEPETPEGGEPEAPPDATVAVEIPSEAPDVPSTPKKKSASQLRTERLNAEIDKIVEAGTFQAKYVPDPLIIKPMGSFVEIVSTAFAGLMERAETPPIDHFQSQVRDEHPDWHPERVSGVAIQRFIAERGRLAVVSAAQISAESNLMYELAGLAVGHDREWAETNLLPGEAMRITKAGIIIGEVRDYLGESLSILGTEVVEEPEEEDAKAEAPTPEQSGAGSEAPSSASTDSDPKDSTS